MEVDVISQTADSNTIIDKARILWVPSEFKSLASIQGILRIPGRSCKFSESFFSEYAKARYCKLSLAKDLQEVGLIHSSEEVYENIWSEGISIQVVSLVKH